MRAVAGGDRLSVKKIRRNALRTFLLHLAAIGLFVGATIGLPAEEAQGKTPPSAAPHHIASETIPNPVADPRAVVVVGKARFTVLTPEMIRMEWTADGKFEDHASFVFINRRLPVPTFSKEEAGKKLTLKTSALSLTYDRSVDDGKLTPENLSVELTVNGRQVTWHPGMTDTENLEGTTRTLDGARGGKTAEPMEQGLVSAPAGC